MNEYTDVHYHRSYDRNEDIIMNGMQQMNEIYK